MANGGPRTSVGWLTGFAALCALAIAPSALAGPAEAPLIGARFAIESSTSERGSRLARLAVLEIPAGMDAVVRCVDRAGNPGSLRRCPLRRLERGFESARAEQDFAPRFPRRLRPGTEVSVRITAPGARGKLLEIEIRKGRVPAVTLTNLTTAAVMIPAP